MPGRQYNKTMATFRKSFIDVFLALSLLISLIGCQRVPPTQTTGKSEQSPAEEPSDIPVIPTEPSLEPTGAPTMTPIPEPGATRYIFYIQLDLTDQSLFVDERIFYKNNYPEPLGSLVLVIPPNRQAGVFHLNTLEYTDGSNIDDYLLESGQLTLELVDSLKTGETIGLHISYELILPSGSGLLGYTGRQLNLGDWYPFVPVYMPGAGWLSHAPGSAGESLVYDLADYDVTLTLMQPDEGLIVAASAPEEPIENGWHFTLPNARSFALSLSREYRISQTYVNGVLVRSYSFPEHAGQGETVMRASADALALFDELYGHYPHSALAAVEGDLADGMEYSGMYFLSESFYRNDDGEPLGYLVSLSAHETAHNWFYGLVGNDPALEPWLDEALCTYSESLFFERYYPDQLDSWWRFRVESFSPSGWVDGTIYDHGGFRPYVNAVYLRGARFLDELRNLVGDEPFFAFIWDYIDQTITRGAGHLSTTRLFFAILEEHTELDFKDLVSDYFASKP